MKFINKFLKKISEKYPTLLTIEPIEIKKTSNDYQSS